MDDSKILDLYWVRSESAISETMVKYGRYCNSIAMNILGNIEDADECVNDTYLRAWNAIPPTRPNNLAVYLGTITRRLSLNRYNKNHTEKRGHGQVEIALSELEEAIPDASASFYENIDGEIITSAINHFLAKLPKKQRNVFVRRYWHIRSTEEIADDYGLTVQNVKQILFRCRIKLKSVLEKEGISV